MLTGISTPPSTTPKNEPTGQNRPLSSAHGLFPRPNIDQKTLMHDWEYANHIADIVAPTLGETAIMGSYLGVTGYAGMNLYNIARKEYREIQEAQSHERVEKLKKAIINGADEALMELGGTLLIPLYVSRKLHHGLEHALEHAHNLPVMFRERARLISALTALASIPVLGKPSHKAMKAIMNWTYRPLVGKRPLPVSPFFRAQLPAAVAQPARHSLTTTYAHPKMFSAAFE